MVKISCFASKVFNIIVTLSVAALEPTYSKWCKAAIFQFKDSNIYLDAYPRLILACILVSNSIYAGATMVKFDKKVCPVVNLPHVPIYIAVEEQENSHQNSINHNRLKIERIEQDPNIFHEEVDIRQKTML